MKILIIKISSIGDIVETLPSLNLLRKSFPKAQIDWVAGDRCNPIIKNNKKIDDLFIFSRGYSYLKNFKELLRLRKDRYDYLFDFQSSRRSTFIGILARSKKKFGMSKRLIPILLQKLFYTNQKKLNIDKHDIEDMLDLLKFMNITPDKTDLSLSLKPIPKAKDFFISLKKQGFRHIVGLHIGAGREFKTWPIENFNQLFSSLPDFLFVVFKGPMESKLISSLEKRKNVIIKTLSLENLHSYIKECDLFLSADSAMMHIADATGVKLIALMGPTSPKRWGPYRKGNIVICKSHFKVGELIKDISIHELHDSMKKISVEEVKQAILTNLD